MRIGIDARLWSETGVGRYIRNLTIQLSLLDKKNNYFIFVIDSDIAKIKREITASNFEIVSTKIKWHTIQEQLKYSNQLKKYNLDLMHFTYFSIPINYNKPFVLTIHDLIIHHFPTGKASTLPSPIYYLKRLAYMYSIQNSADRALKIITPSNATKAEVVDHLTIPSNKISVIYEGFDEQISDNQTTPIIKDKYILYVGNAYPHKNLPRLIESFERARKGDEKLVLVGKENFFYKRLKKENPDKEDSVVFFGEATDSQLSNLYKNANAFVMPSLMEGFGLPPLEAMAHKCFVMASKIPAIEEICQDAALYFDPYKTSDIEDKIRFAFSASDKKSFIEKGTEILKQFSWTKMARETLKVYESSVSIRQSEQMGRR